MKLKEMSTVQKVVLAVSVILMVVYFVLVFLGMRGIVNVPRIAEHLLSIVISLGFIFVSKKGYRAAWCVAGATSLLSLLAYLFL